MKLKQKFGARNFIFSRFHTERPNPGIRYMYLRKKGFYKKFGCCFRFHWNSWIYIDKPIVVCVFYRKNPNVFFIKQQVLISIDVFFFFLMNPKFSIS